MSGPAVGPEVTAKDPRTAIEMWDDCRGMAREDSDFDSIRDLRAFQELLGR